MPRKPKKSGKLKLKTHKATSKRFRLTGSGILVRTKGGTNEFKILQKIFGTNFVIGIGFLLVGIDGNRPASLLGLNGFVIPISALHKANGYGSSALLAKLHEVFDVG